MKDIRLIGIEGIDYSVVTHLSGSRQSIAHIAIHGGFIETGTSQLAIACARLIGSSYYSFLGIRPESGNNGLHVTSTEFFDQRCEDVVSASSRTISWHGCKGEEDMTYLGGLDSEHKKSLRKSLVREGFHVLNPSDKLSGDDAQNVANRNSRGAGVQVEISSSLRSAMFDDGVVNYTFWRYVMAVTNACMRYIS